MKILKLIIIGLLLYSVSGQGQTMEAGDVFDKVSTIISNMPGDMGNHYTEPGNTQIVDWIEMLDDLFTADYSGADTKAEALGYDLVEFSDNTTNETYYVLEKLADSTNYWGTYILNPHAGMPEIILQAPHPKFDFNTGKQAIYCFKELDAGFFMMSGTHRCNHGHNSSCSGTTEVCGNEGPFKISDLAHTVTSIWQTTTEYLFAQSAGSYFIQLHGFTKTGSDPYVIMSNGTRETPAPDPITAIRDELLVVDPVLTFKIAHLDQNWDRLIGFTNTNGRMINLSNNACTADATATIGRFVHIEQEKTRLRDNSSGWQKMATAISEAFPLSLLPVELSSFELALENDRLLLKWQVESEKNNDFFEIEKSLDGRTFTSIGKINGRGTTDVPKTYEYVDMPDNGLNYYRLRQVDFDGKVHFSPIKNILITGEGDSEVKIWASHNQINILLKSEGLGGAEFQMFDALGRLIINMDLMHGENVFPVDFSKNGFCFYRIIDNGQLLDGGVLSID
ncbi:MAG: hypothetical protein AAFZ15_24560 [Bacteroidota bacterium]